MSHPSDRSRSQSDPQHEKMAVWMTGVLPVLTDDIRTSDVTQLACYQLATNQCFCDVRFEHYQMYSHDIVVISVDSEVVVLLRPHLSRWAGRCGTGSPAPSPPPPCSSTPAGWCWWPAGCRRLARPGCSNTPSAHLDEPPGGGASPPH